MAIAQAPTAPRQRKSTPSQRRPAPPLDSGDRLTRPEFHRRYQAQPTLKKAELIEGVVYVPSPVSNAHAEIHSATIGWTIAYCAATPGLHVSDNATLFLDADNEVQPDICLWLDESAGGRVQVTPDGFLRGVPELIVEIAASSAAYDLHDKMNAYRRNGVQEYLVLIIHEQEARWFRLEDGRYQPLAAESDGVYRSVALPGLWLAPAHLWAGKLAELLALVQQGLASPQHAEFLKSTTATAQD